VWFGDRDTVRDHVIVENRHQPTTIHVKTYVDPRYKLTVYWQRDYGELFDLEADPGEVRNRWDDPQYSALKAELTEKLLLAEMAREETLSAESLRLPQKSPDMYVRTASDDRHHITVDPEGGRFELFDLAEDPGFQTNLWHEPGERYARARMVRELLFTRMGKEPLWMPRICGA
jgi:hypothetical protein